MKLLIDELLDTRGAGGGEAMRHAIILARSATVVVLSPAVREAAYSLSDAFDSDLEVGRQVATALRLPASPFWLEFEDKDGRLGMLAIERPASWGVTAFIGTARVIKRASPAITFERNAGGSLAIIDPEVTPAIATITRLLSCMCAVLNSKAVGAPRIRRAFAVRGAGGNELRYLEAKTLYITVPRERVLAEVLRHCRRSSPRRRHGVLGAWCERHNSGRPGCLHVWGEGAAQNHQACELCGRRRWWRLPCERGDAGRGYVVKRYLAGLAERRRGVSQ